MTARRRCHVKLAGGEIIEEKQWLGALHDEVVDAHGDKIDADRVVHTAFDRDHQLGADAIVGGNQDRILEAGALQIKQAAEAAEVGIRARPAGGFHQWLDSLDECVAGIDIDPGIAVCDRSIRAVGLVGRGPGMG